MLGSARTKQTRLRAAGQNRHNPSICYASLVCCFSRSWLPRLMSAAHCSTGVRGGHGSLRQTTMQRRGVGMLARQLRGNNGLLRAVLPAATGPTAGLLQWGVVAQYASSPSRSGRGAGASTSIPAAAAKAGKSGVPRGPAPPQAVAFPADERVVCLLARFVCTLAAAA